MARPKRNQDGPNALDRIEEAFWGMLAEGAYEAITITGLARRAGVNHNTIYYHFSGMDDLALRLFHKNVPEGICDMFRAMLLKGPEELERFMFQEDILARWQRVCLFARGDSPFLFQTFRSMIIQNWYQILGITPEELTREEDAELEFLLSGLIALLGKAFRQNDPMLMRDLLDRPVGQGVLATLRALYRGPKPQMQKTLFPPV